MGHDRHSAWVSRRSGYRPGSPRPLRWGLHADPLVLDGSGKGRRRGERIALDARGRQAAYPRAAGALWPVWPQQSTGAHPSAALLPAGGDLCLAACTARIDAETAARASRPHALAGRLGGDARRGVCAGSHSDRAADRWLVGRTSGRGDAGLRRAPVRGAAPI